MRWFPSSRRRADADARRRHVRPALESLECRIVPQGSPIPTFSQGVAYATQQLANVGSNPQSRLLTDLTLIVNAMNNAATNASTIEVSNIGLQATNQLIGGLQLPGMLSIADLQQNINFSEGAIQSDYGIISVARADLVANLQAPLMSGGVFAGISSSSLSGQGDLGGIGGGNVGGTGSGGFGGIGGGGGFGGIGGGGFGG